MRGSTSSREQDSWLVDGANANSRRARQRRLHRHCGQRNLQLVAFVYELDSSDCGVFAEQPAVSREAHRVGASRAREVDLVGERVQDGSHETPRANSKSTTPHANRSFDRSFALRMCQLLAWPERYRRGHQEYWRILGR